MTGSQLMRHIASTIKAMIPGYGFCVLVYEHNKPMMANYISNSDRADMINALRETADRLENNETFKTPGEN